MDILKLIEAVQQARAAYGSDSVQYKEALCDFGIEVARQKKVAKLKEASHKLEYSERNYQLRETIKTDAERCRIVEHDMAQEILEVSKIKAEATELSEMYRAFRILLPKNEYSTDVF